MPVIIHVNYQLKQMAFAMLAMLPTPVSYFETCRVSCTDKSLSYAQP
jgi:hypothetical protein